MGFTKLFGVVAVFFLGCARVVAQDDTASQEDTASQNDSHGQQGQALQQAAIKRVVVEGELIGWANSLKLAAHQAHMAHLRRSTRREGPPNAPH